MVPNISGCVMLMGRKSLDKNMANLDTHRHRHGVCVGVFEGLEEQNKNKGLVGYSSVLPQVCQS